MRILNNIDQLLNLTGERIAFFGETFNPPHFGHLNFIKKASAIKQIDHIILCPQSQEDEQGIEALKHRLRIMDLIMETNSAIDMFVLSPNVYSGVESNILIDDIFYLLKRRKKEVFILVGCDSLEKCAKAFRSRDVTFVVGCRIKRSDAEKQLVAKQMKCVFIDDIIPCSAEQLKEDITKRNVYLSPKLIEYIESNQLYWFNADCENCN